jgi:hypothetical protein
MERTSRIDTACFVSRGGEVQRSQQPQGEQDQTHVSMLLHFPPISPIVVHDEGRLHEELIQGAQTKVAMVMKGLQCSKRRGRVVEDSQGTKGNKGYHHRHSWSFGHSCVAHTDAPPRSKVIVFFIPTSSTPHPSFSSHIRMN